MNKLLQYLISETNVEHRVLPGLQKMKKGGPIVDPRGQWAHPGKVTRIPSPNITMQGVDYPVYGVGSNGQEQMMYPEQEYDFGGASYVDEYPMMQFGGGTLLGPAPMMTKIAPSIINMFSGNPLKKFIKWVNEPSETTGSTSRPSPLPVEGPVRTYGYADTHSEYRDRANDVYSELKNNDAKEYNSPNQISLSSGRFRGAKVDPEMINDIVKAAKDNNVDPWVMLSLVGRESTFGSGTVQNVRRAGDKQDLVSGWNVAEDYMPYEFNRFLADKQVPGVKVLKNNDGWHYEVKDKKAVDDYLRKNPQLIDSYYKKIESTPDLGGLDSFALAAQRIKKKGIQNYNPGDPRYPSMVNEDMNLLKQDAELKAYMKSKGYKYGGGLLSKTVSCSNCGHSWKGVEGGIDPLNCHKCGGLVKMQRAGEVKKNPYTEVNSSAADTFRSLVPLPDNAAQMLAKVVFQDARMSNNSLSDDQKLILWNTIQNAKKRSGKNSGGGTEYQDYGNQGYGSSDEFNQWFNRGKVGVLDGSFKSLTNPGFKLASTIGRGRYWQDPDNPDDIQYTDVYDWNPSEANFKGSNAYQLLRNKLRSGEDKNLNKDKNDNYRMNFKLSKKEIEEIKKRKEEKDKSIMGLGLFERGGQMMQTGGGYTFANGKMNYTGETEDSTLENIVEFIEPTGISSWNDARKAYNSWKKSGKRTPSLEQGLDMFGAVPGLGKFGKLKYLADPDAMKAVYKFFPWQQTINVIDSAQDELEKRKSGGQHGGLDRWFAEKWVDVKTGKDCGRQEGEKSAGYPACRPSKRVSSETPKTSSEMSSSEKAKFKASKTSSQRINYNHKRNK